MNRRTGLLTGVSLASALVGGTAIAWWYARPPSTVGHDGISVREIDVCSEELPWGEPSKVESVSQGGTGLVVRVLANVSCGGVQPVEPSASIQGKIVQISWFWYAPPNEAVAACLCTKGLEFLVPRAAGMSSPNIALAEPKWKQ
jgi:hypothetical protein